jgi:hypothetical protein
MKEETAIRQRIYGLIDRMSKRVGIEIPRENYPAIITEKDALEYRNSLNELAIDPRYLNSGESLGEEIAHFIRNYTKTIAGKKPLSRLSYYLRHPRGNELDRVPSQEQKQDVHADEFFGYLGRKILQEIATEEDNLKFGVRTKAPREQTRKDRLEHERPYKFASQLDLSKISDYNSLFTLPDKEVRSRFFRSDPQYNLSKPLEEAKITRRNTQTTQPRLEAIVRVIAPIFLILSIFLTSRKMITGSVIGYSGFINTIPLITILLISLIFFIIIGIKKKR